MAEALRLGVTLLAPVMPATVDRVRAALGLGAAGTWSDELQWGERLTGSRCQAALVLFPAAGAGARSRARSVSGKR